MCRLLLDKFNNNLNLVNRWSQDSSYLTFPQISTVFSIVTHSFIFETQPGRLRGESKEIIGLLRVSQSFP